MDNESNCCGNCKHWGSPATQQIDRWDSARRWPNQPRAVTRPCARIVQLFEYTKGERGLECTAFLDESDMYECDLRTTAAFYCAHYERVAG